jgi:hypothetical protein
VLGRHAADPLVGFDAQAKSLFNLTIGNCSNRIISQPYVSHVTAASPRELTLIVAHSAADSFVVFDFSC